LLSDFCDTFPESFCKAQSSVIRFRNCSAKLKVLWDVSGIVLQSSKFCETFPEWFCKTQSSVGCFAQQKVDISGF